MRVDRRIAIKRIPEGIRDISHILFVGLSQTLGVVERWMWSRSRDQLHSIVNHQLLFGACVGNGGVVDITARHLTFTNLRTGAVRYLGKIHQLSGKAVLQQVWQGRKWMVLLYNSLGYIVILRISGGLESGCCGIGKEDVSVVDVGTKGFQLHLITEDEAAVIIVSGTVLYVDLKASFETHRLVVTHTVSVLSAFTFHIFHSKKYGLLSYTPSGCDSSEHLQWTLQSLQSLKVLHMSEGFVYKVDHTHFAEKSKGTLSIFSTDHFDHPLRVFQLSELFHCENGFVVFHCDARIDLVDAVTGTWLLCQPTAPSTHWHIPKKGLMATTKTPTVESNGAGSLVDEANAGNTEAMTRLGVHHLMGSHGAARSPDEALRWFNRARSGDGLFCVGCYCYDGLGGAARDPDKAVSVWTTAAVLGSGAAMARLGWCYQHGAVSVWTTAAVLGSGAAMARLGWCYQHGVGVECDKPRAVELYAAAISKSSELHSWRLGVCYLRGEGVGRDLGLAAELIQQSAGGDEDALAYLGWCYLWGCGVGMDLEKAVELLTSASSTLDNCKAKVFLGYCHERGIGVALDTNKARELFHEANTRPGTEALGEIGEYCLKGDCGAPTDKRAAVGYLEMGMVWVLIVTWSSHTTGW
ncbi:calmodulin-dependent protein kinase [Pelomyxa schiedti]|nr:calmodulin-dependent protein kinase [Pelomyxa schiedti]